MFKLLSFLCLFVHIIVFGQDTLKMKLNWEKSFNGNLVGSIDEQQNAILFDDSEIIKLNPMGEMLFHQSVKSLGKIKEIDARNPFKILLFSENQQSINFIDNSLSLQNETIELITFDLNNVVSTSGSDQMDKCWAYNQDNSILKLIGKNEQQFQTIINIKQLVNLTSIDKIIEANNLLYLLDFSGKVVILDLYGNLKSTYDFTEYKTIIIDKDNLYIQLKENILIYNITQKKQLGIIKTPINSVVIGKNGAFLFFTEKNKISKFTLLN